MEIGMIGAGRVGSALARRFKAVGHDVLSANSPHPDTIATLAVAIGAHPVTSFEAARAGDVVVTAIPLIAILELGKPREDRGRTALPVAADRQTDKQAVKQLIDQTGFDPIDAGRSGRVLASGTCDAETRDRPRCRGWPSCARGSS